MNSKVPNNLLDDLYADIKKNQLSMEELKEKYSREEAKKKCTCVKCDHCLEMFLKKNVKKPVAEPKEAAQDEPADVFSKAKWLADKAAELKNKKQRKPRQKKEKVEKPDNVIDQPVADNKLLN